MPKRAAKRLTRAILAKLAPRSERYDVLCSAVEGFGVRVHPTGVRAAFLRYWRDGKYWRLSLGRLCDTFTLDQARTDAMGHRAEIDRGGHPARDRRLARDAPSFAEVAERYMTELARPYRKPSTARGYESLLRVHLLPGLGHMKIGEIERADVQRLHQRIGEKTPGAANRALALVSVIMTNAERWGYRDTRANPCHRMEKFPERKMERFLSAEERAQLDAVLAEGEACVPGQRLYIGSTTITALRLLLMTGARLGEITGLRWRMVDFERQCLRLPDSKTREKIIPLSPPTVEMLRALDGKRHPGEAWVCPCKRGGGPLQNLEGSWQRIRARAGLDDVRLHDLRHSAASDAIAAGVPLALIGAMLGHKRPETTARYAHLADAPLREAARRMGEAIERSAQDGAELLRKREREQQEREQREQREQREREQQEQEREQQQRAVGADDDQGSAGANVIALDGGAKVIPLRRRGP